jgi:hypothetical protein
MLGVQFFNLSNSSAVGNSGICCISAFSNFANQLENGLFFPRCFLIDVMKPKLFLKIYNSFSSFAIVR